MPLHERLVTTFFQTVSASTTDGFNTIDIGKMSPLSLTVICFLMFVGASPGSTGGGIKTTTLGVLVVFFIGKLRERGNNLFKREIPDKSAHNAVIVFLSFVLVVFTDLTIMTVTENATYLQILFEICSALGNTGLSTGITLGLSVPGRIILTLTMFIGRVGPLAIAYALLPRPANKGYRYAQEDVFVG
jgi:trk system potassium uptake protein